MAPTVYYPARSDDKAEIVLESQLSFGVHDMTKNKLILFYFTFLAIPAYAVDITTT